MTRLISYRMLWIVALTLSSAGKSEPCSSESKALHGGTNVLFHLNPSYRWFHEKASKRHRRIS